uniref:Uncharacterized protein n=1 Tax=Romanomermis culicivorax TaxID=13658 RepID=A0A915HW03_ROMCU
MKNVADPSYIGYHKNGADMRADLIALKEVMCLGEIKTRSRLVISLEEHTFLWRELAEESTSPICCAEGGNVVFKNFHCILKDRKIL